MQVADLVVERLDSRLAVRDKAFNVDVVTSRVTESVEGLLKSLYEMPAALNTVFAAQEEVEKAQNRFTASQAELKDAEHILQKFDQLQAVSAPEPDSNVLIVKEVVEKLAVEQHKLAQQSDETVSHNKAVMDKLAALPDSFKDVTTSLQAGLMELITSRDATKCELEELRKTNTENQVQVAKARGAHGQVRVEKDVLAKKLGIVEGDRDRLRAQVKDLWKTTSDKVKDISALEVKYATLEAALSKAPERLQDSDVAATQDKQKIANLEKANRELLEEKQGLNIRVESFEAEVKFAFREHDSALKAHESLQKQQQELIAQQGKWEILDAATEKINMVFNLENADSEEQKELRLHQDRSMALENENLALQKCLKELEAKVANSDRAAATARQSLTQAQQRSSDWEHRAKEYEGQVEMIQTQLEQAEQTQHQLQADYNTLKEEQEADSRLAKDHKERLQPQISALESKCSVLQKLTPTELPLILRLDLTLELAQSTMAVGVTLIDVYPRPGMHFHHRKIPSPLNQSKIQSPLAATGHYSNYTPSTPKARLSMPLYNNSYRASRGPSPTPSVVSAVPTQGDDGWWS
ncbi:hypothetical protein BJ165DRAFT_1535149 [Panaeolus papilionaceus]|nr:hypothetical protein BJ165DRAFT_1535149 [Panaeolus papilionaceus]